MAEKVKGVMVGCNNGIRDGLIAELSNLVGFTERFDDCSTAYVSIKDLQPETVFIDVDIDKEGGLSLAGRLKKTMPGMVVFLVSGEKDPDVILKGLRIGVADFLLFPGKEKELRKSVQKVLGRSETGGRSGETTAVFSMKGGQGVTSIAVNLADHIHALTKDRVVLFDMNLFMGDVSVFLELAATYTPFDMLKDIERMDENLLFSSLPLHTRGFHILASPDEVSDADRVNGEDITRILKTLGRYLDHIVIDLPHDFTEKSLAAIEAADTLLVLVQQSMPVIRSTQIALKFFEELGYDENKVKIVLNRELKKNELTTDDISYVLNRPVFASIDNDFATLADAINKGKTLASAKPDSAVNSDMETLAYLLTGIKQKPKITHKGIREIVSRFLPGFKGRGGNRI